MTAKTTKTTKAKPATKPVVADIQAKAKAALAMGASAFDEIKGLTKANAEAVVESGKILGSGLKQLGAGYVAEGRSAVETLNTDLKELGTVKSPADFFKLQSKLVSRNFDATIAFGKKNTGEVLTLVKSTAAPLSKRVKLTVESLRKAA